jgi:hypothetical protein
MFKGLWSRIVWLSASVSKEITVYFFMVHVYVTWKMEKAKPLVESSWNVMAHGDAREGK